MSLLDVQIDRLTLDVSGAAGQEHRIRPIAARAAAILAERLDEEESDWQGPKQNGEALRGPQAKVDLARMTDEDAARQIARSWISALGLQMR